MAIYPATGDIWINEHGPKGGDEINILQPGENYGWPLLSFGREYSGGQVGEGQTSKKGYADSVWHWTPSIAPSGMAFYEGEMFPEFTGKLLVSSLKFRSVYLVDLDKGKPVKETAILKNEIGRIRDIEIAADGSILILTDEDRGGIYRLYR
jgi:glucose/arabinose dehydrogenase